MEVYEKCLLNFLKKGKDVFTMNRTKLCIECVLHRGGGFLRKNVSLNRNDHGKDDFGVVKIN